MALIAVLGYRQVDLSLKVLGVLVAAEFIIVLILDVAILVKGGAGGSSGLSGSSFTPGALMSGSLAIALLFNSASFIGFEATTIYSEEAKDPKRTVPRATYVAVLTIGLFYTVTTWLMVNAQGGQGLQEYIGGLKPDPTAFLFVLSDTYIGSNLTTVMTLLFATSVFAALLAFHNAVARYFFALGREGLLPTPLEPPHGLAEPVGSRLCRRAALRRHGSGPGARAVHVAHPARDARHPHAHGALLLRGDRLLHPPPRVGYERAAHEGRPPRRRHFPRRGRHLCRLAVRAPHRQSRERPEVGTACPDRRGRRRPKPG